MINRALGYVHGKKNIPYIEESVSDVQVGFLSFSHSLTLSFLKKKFTFTYLLGREMHMLPCVYGHKKMACDCQSSCVFSGVKTTDA